MPELRNYETQAGECPFAAWFEGLNAPAAAKVTTALIRLAQGNKSQVKPVGAGVSELKIDWGPGYRVYFGSDGEALIILVCGGTKKRQDKDIAAAKAHWADYRARKKEDGGLAPWR